MSLEIFTCTVIGVEEGFREEPYLCSEGYVTVGYGTKLHNDTGMNPEDFPLVVSKKVAFAMMQNDISWILFKLENNFEDYTPIFLSLSTQRKAIIASMAYQMGFNGLSKFKKMWRALEVTNYHKASLEMLDSLWAVQTPNRANRHAKAMVDGTLEEYVQLWITN